MTDPAPLPPLAGLKIIDFSTLLPGPLASLILAEAGATVVKIERPEGEDLRRYPGAFNGDSAAFVLLNRLKTSLCIDLKHMDAFARLQPYLETADVLIEQFRPGVMERLGFGWGRLRALNPRLIYCSITGYGSKSPRRDVAGHDLNYAALTGVLDGGRGGDGVPALPPVLAADIAGGAYPAVMNILLTLRQRDATGAGCHLDIAMADNMFTFAYGGLADGFATGHWPRPGAELLSGGSPRYQIYPTADGRFLAAAPIEDRFWVIFCDAIGLPAAERDDSADPGRVIARVKSIIAAETTDTWRARFAGRDVCVEIVATMEEAARDPAFARLFTHNIVADGRSLPALPVPVAPSLRQPNPAAGYARLGNADIGNLWQRESDHD
ncbi:MAG: CoA transferase [Xanthobacteraceae bacterium]|nr:MAG: CoA transferase [Xanthobacteraceae bacterium]